MTFSSSLFIYFLDLSTKCFSNVILGTILDCQVSEVERQEKLIKKENLGFGHTFKKIHLVSLYLCFFIGWLCKPNFVVVHTSGIKEKNAFFL